VAHAFDGLYRRHWDDVYRLSLRYAGGDQGWAEDLAHDVFIKLLEHLPTLDRPMLADRWLYRVTANLAVSRLRRQQSWLGRLSKAWRALQTPSASSPEVVAVRSEESARAMASLRRLPARERVVMCMKVMDGMKQSEIAEVLGVSAGHVSKLCSRALARVRADGWEIDDGSL
jgi:RNA polymerase sigma-70 factor (ECF subfamily)